MTPADLKGSVIAHRNDRMGARIIAMLNAIRISRDYDMPWFCGWTTGGRTHEECRDPTFIFDDDFVAEKFFDADVVHKVYSGLIDLTTIDGSDGGEEKFRKRVGNGKSYLSGAAMGITVLPWEDPKTVAHDLPLCLSEFQFSAPVKAMVAEIDEKFAGSTLTALHIRRGDIIHDQITSNKLWPNKYIPREFYEVHLDRLLEDPTTRVLVFSDTPEEVVRLKAKSDRVVGINDLFGERDFTTGARDFLELYAMSQCKRIYGPPSSAYSQTATVIGGCTLKAVQDALSPEDYARAMDLMTTRLEQKSDLFINMGDVGQCLHFLIEHQLEKDDPARAKRIIQSYLEDGLDKSFAYTLLCELAVATDELPYIERIRDLAYARPVYVDESMATVNAYSAIHHMQQGDGDTAHQRLSCAQWFRPLDPLVQGALSLGLTTGVLTPENFYPFDPLLNKTKGGVFPNGKKALADLNLLDLKDLDANDRKTNHPWEIVVRDWRMVSGKRLNRAFFNKSKTVKAMERLERLYSNLDGAPSLTSAMGVLQFATGSEDAALEAQKAAIAEAPDVALFHKRYADVLFEQGDEELGLKHLEQATEIAAFHPCYVAELGQRFWNAKKRQRSWKMFDHLTRLDHGFIEINIMTALMLRRDPERLNEALDQLDRADRHAHGAHRIMMPRARILMTLKRYEDALEIYQNLADWGLGTEHTFAEIYRNFNDINRLDVARALIDSSAFEFAVVEDLVAQKGWA